MAAERHPEPAPTPGWSDAFGDIHAVVIGGSGGIGAAVAAQLLDTPCLASLVLCSRSALPETDAPGLSTARVDFADEASIEALGRSLPHAPNLDFNCAGLLHDQPPAGGQARSGAGMTPERRLKELDPARLHAAFTVNAIGPLLLAKHLVPRMPRDAHAVFASLSARVGSVSDNRLGGWYSYRMSKAAHNMGLRCVAIEASRRNRQLVCVNLHPGTVDTALSAPFQGNVPEGKLFTPAQAAAKLLNVIGTLRSTDSGGFLAHDGTPIPY